MRMLRPSIYQHAQRLSAGLQARCCSFSDLPDSAVADSARLAGSCPTLLGGGELGALGGQHLSAGQLLGLDVDERGDVLGLLRGVRVC